MYEKSGSQFIYRRKASVQYSTEEVALCYDAATFKLHRHGPPKRVRDWFFKQVKNLRDAQAFDEADKLGFISSSAWDVAALNAALNSEAAVRILVESHPSTQAPKIRTTGTGRNEIVGTISALIFDRPEFAVAQLAERDETGSAVTVAGRLTSIPLSRGVTYRFLGCWREHPRYGRRFEFSTFATDRPATRAGMVQYLRNIGDNIGQVRAERLWDEFGADTVEVILTNPSRVVATGILNNAQALAANKSLQEMEAHRRTLIDLYGLFAGTGIPGNVIDAAIQQWGVRAPEVIRSNPYVLLESRIAGCGYARVDKLYMALGLDPISPVRQMYAAYQGVASVRDGHTWVDRGDIVAEVNRLLGEHANPTVALRSAVDAGILQARRQDNTWYVSLPMRSANEEFVAASVARMISDTGGDNPPSWPEVAELRGLTDHQRAKIGPAMRGRFWLLAGSAGTGKAQPLDAKIMTPYGWTTMGDIKVDDKIVGSNGGLSTVIAIHEQGQKQVYRVIFSDGSSTECCGDHLWLTEVKQSRDYNRVLGKPLFSKATVRTTDEIASTLLSTSGSKNHYVPMVGAVNFSSSDNLPLDPYLVGVLLGNGCFRTGCQVRVSISSNEMLNILSSLLPEGHSLVCRKDSLIDFRVNGLGTGNQNKVNHEIRLLGLDGLKSEDKFVPDKYKFGSVECRLAVIQGLCDTDGYTDGHTIDYSTSSRQLADDMRFMVESLGGTASTTWRIPKYMYLGKKLEGLPNARIRVNLPSCFSPFRIAAKKDKHKIHTKYQPSRSIVSVKAVPDKKECRCITVDADDCLYVTDNFIVTHNSYSLAAVVNARVAQGRRVAVCCPTGKAAVRITEVMRAAGMMVQATTVHSLLRVRRVPSDAHFVFDHNEHESLPFDDVFCDEISCLDVDLFAALCRALPSDSCLIGCGDPYQLPPVGHGAALRDLLLCPAVPRAELQEVHRSGGLITLACQAIRQRKRWQPAPQYIPPDQNLRHQECKTPAASLASLGELLKRFQATGSRFDPIRDVQVICVVNKDTPLSKRELNEFIQKQLNPNGFGTGRFRVGDKVICLRNGWQRDVEPPPGTNPLACPNAAEYEDAWIESRDSDQPHEPALTFVANGDMGIVRAVSDRHVVVSFSNYRLCRFAYFSRKDEDGADAGDLDLGYAITVHRFQGSEVPCAIFMIDSDRRASFVASRELVYTAMSRGRRLVVTIGEMAKLNEWCNKGSLMRRKTFLRERIMEYLPL